MYDKTRDTKHKECGGHVFGGNVGLRKDYDE